MSDEEYIFESTSYRNSLKEIKQVENWLNETYTTDTDKYTAAIEILQILGYGWMRFPDGHHEVYE